MVQIEQTTDTVKQELIENSATSLVNTDLLVGILGIALPIMFVLGIIWYIIHKIISKMKDIREKRENLEYYKYDVDLKMCKLNADTKYRYRNFLTLFLTFKRAKVYAQTTNGRKYIGNYEGSANKKEGFNILAIEQKHSFFKREVDIVIIPNEIEHILKFEVDNTVTLICEGIDEVMSSEYYSIPIIINPNSVNKPYIDFSNMIMEKYFREYVYRDVIRHNITEFRENIKEAVEMNSSVQMDRKTHSHLEGR